MGDVQENDSPDELLVGSDKMPPPPPRRSSKALEEDVEAVSLGRPRRSPRQTRQITPSKREEPPSTSNEERSKRVKTVAPRRLTPKAVVKPKKARRVKEDVFNEPDHLFEAKSLLFKPETDIVVSYDLPGP